MYWWGLETHTEDERKKKGEREINIEREYIDRQLYIFTIRSSSWFRGNILFLDLLHHISCFYLPSASLFLLVSCTGVYRLLCQRYRSPPYTTVPGSTRCTTPISRDPRSDTWKGKQHMLIINSWYTCTGHTSALCYIDWVHYVTGSFM